MKETFGQYIRQLRLGKSYTLTQLAAMLGIDSSALSKIETDKKSLDERLLPKFAEIFLLDPMHVKKEYYSEAIAKVLYENQCDSEVLILAEEKVKYIRSKNTKQTNLNLE
jgi:transcriptional regulator with XRE-family HTH domain